MLSEDLRACLKPVVIVQKVIWFALTAPIPIYLSVLFGRDGGSELPLPALPGWLGAVFTTASRSGRT